MHINVSPRIARVMERAVAISVQAGHYYVGVEHLFGALLEASDELPPKTAGHCLDGLWTVYREVQREGWQGPALGAPTGEIFHTPRAIAATQEAGRLAERGGSGECGHGHLLAAILADPHSAPSRAMDRLGLDRGEVLVALMRELHQREAPPAPERPGPAAAREDGAGPAPSQVREGTPEPRVAPSPGGLPKGLLRDLSDAARSGLLEEAVGRNDEMLEVLQILARKSKGNAMLVGEAGVGKTQLVEGLALKMAKTELGPDAPRLAFLELNVGALMAGTQYRGQLEEKLLGLIEELKQKPDTVLFIDEVHLIMGAGATQDDGMDVANLLKPVLARGEIKCIGATTLAEYRKFVERDPAIERRFQMVRVEPLSEEATLTVLKRLRPSFERHHGVRIGGRALVAAVQLTQRYMPNRQLPDKAIDVIDQACARYRLRAVAFDQTPTLRTLTGLGLEGNGSGPTEDKVTPHDIRKVVSQLTAVPIEELTAQERMNLTNLEALLKERLIGQEEAIRRTVAAVKKSRAGLADPNRPDAILLFAGPSGVGKTQLAKLLAEALFGARSHLLNFDMSEYVEEHSVAKLLGAPPGYAGHDEEGRLTAAVRNHPFSVLLFDEVEKAHGRVFDVLLPVFEEGRLKDARGRDVDFRNCIIIMTSNAGAEVLAKGPGEGMAAAVCDALRAHFRPEFINRIDDIVPFYPLLAEDIRSILRLEINAVRHRLRDKRIGIRMYQLAYEHLAKEGYNAQFGARELRRAVDRLITQPLSAMVLQGEIAPGDMAEVLMDNGEFVVRKGRQDAEAAAERRA